MPRHRCRSQLSPHEKPDRQEAFLGKASGDAPDQKGQAVVLWHIDSYQGRMSIGLGAVHSVKITAANKTDINALPKPLQALDEAICGDALPLAA